MPRNAVTNSNNKFFKPKTHQNMCQPPIILADPQNQPLGQRRKINKEECFAPLRTMDKFRETWHIQQSKALDGGNDF